MAKCCFCITVAVFFFSQGLSAQTYSTGTESKKADDNFTELANYYKEYPEPFVRKMPMNEDEDEGQPGQPEPDASLIHVINRAARAHREYGGGPALLPASPAPYDTFLSTLSDGTGIPPDTHGAVDSQYCVTAINTAVHIQTRTGTNVHNVSLDAFWASVLPGGTGSFDPRIHYDPYNKRWILVSDAVSNPAMTGSTILIAVSATNDPTGTWHKYAIPIDPTGATWLDFPCVGFNQKWITVTGNIYTNPAGSSSGAVVYVFNYANILAGTGAPFTKITETGSFTLCPATTYSATESSMFLIEISNPGSGKLQLWKITGAVGSPVIASVGFPANTQHWHRGGSADFVPQVADTAKLQAGDGRITNFTFRNNKLWCAHTVFLPDPGAASRCSIMWWQMDTLASPIQVGLIDDPATPAFFDFPSIAVNSNDDALIGFGYLSSFIHPSAGYALHMHTDPADSMRPVHVFRHGQATYYETFGGTQDRWGDFSATCVDPINDLDFWTIQESSFVGASPNWDTWWANVQVCPADALFSVSFDTLNINVNDTVTYTGTAPAGTTYSWNFGTGATPSTSTSAGPINVKWAATGSKVITLTVTGGGCSTTYTDSVLVRNAAGVKTLNGNGQNLQIIPNPNTGTFEVVFNRPVIAPVTIRLFDMQGRLVYNNRFAPDNSNRVSVGANGLVPGIYVADIDVNGEVVKQKLTIYK